MPNSALLEEIKKQFGQKVLERVIEFPKNKINMERPT